MITEYYIKLIIMCSFLFYLGCNDNAPPDPPFPQVSLSTSKSSILVGESFTLDVNVVNIEALSYISFEILFDPYYLKVDMESGVINFYEDNGLGGRSYVFLDTLGVLSVALGGNDIDGNIFSFDLIGIRATLSETELELDQQKINLIWLDGMIVSDKIITDLNGSIVRGVEIEVTIEEVTIE